MQRQKPEQPGKFLVNIKDFALFCIPLSLLACIFAYVQLVIVSGLDINSVNFALPILFGTAVGLLLIFIKRQSQNLSQQMITDPLTGTLNRRWYESIRNEVLQACRKDRRPLSAVLFDIDHFKQINDVNGHQVGDNVLRQLTQIVSRSLRGSDWLVRWGGEEFMILLPGTPTSGAMTIAERLRKVIASYSFNDASLVTCSFGVAELTPESDGDLERLLARADAALLAAKKAGRNRVQDAEDEQVASAQNAELDKQVNGKRMNVREIGMLTMQKHAQKLLDAVYVKRLMTRSIIAGVVIFPLLALAKLTLVDGVSVGPQHLLLPLLTGFGLGYLVGKLRIMDKAIKTQNVIDPLTKTYNRHWLAGYGRQQIQIARRTGNALALALLDIDEFKAVNSRHGTTTGDLILQQVADIIRSACNEPARVIRWSGKMFMVILPGMGADQALATVEKVRAGLDASPASELKLVTCSIGLTCFDKDHDTELHHLVERANRAVNQARQDAVNSIRVG